MNNYPVTKSSKNLVEQICQRDGISYSIEVSKNGNGYTLVADIPRKRFREIVEDVECEKQRGDSKIPVYSYRTLQNGAKRERLAKQNGTTAFHVLKKDRDKMKKEVRM